MNTEKEKQAIKYLQSFEPDRDPYYLAYSGGKDSDTILILAELAGVKFEAVHNLTTVDAPETVRYVKSKENVRIDKPDTTMWKLIVEKGMPPTRLVRYCCAELKERGGARRTVVTGVRKAESVKREESVELVKFMNAPKKIMKEAEKVGAKYRVTKQGGIVLNNDNGESRELVEHCYAKHKILVNPIYDWNDDEVWEFLKHYGCKSNPLYECGWNRIGCIGCPMASKARYTAFRQYPKYKLNYIRAFDRMLKSRKERGMPSKGVWGNTGVNVFKWWMNEDINQLSWFDDEYEELYKEYNG